MGFTDRLALPKDITDSLETLNPEELADLKGKLPSLPDSYFELLEKVGHGDLGVLIVYSSPLDPAHVYPQPGESLEGILLFGDDMQGYCFGFDTREENRVIEIDPRGHINREIESSFEEFIMASLTGESPRLDSTPPC